MGIETPDVVGKEADHWTLQNAGHPGATTLIVRQDRVIQTMHIKQSITACSLPVVVNREATEDESHPGVRELIKGNNHKRL